MAWFSRLGDLDVGPAPLIQRSSLIEENFGGSKSTEARQTLKILRTDKRETVSISLISFRPLREYYQKLLTENRPEFLLNNDDKIDIFDVTLVDEIFVSHPKNSLKTMKNERAPGLSGISVELLKARTDSLLELVAYVSNWFLKGEELPSEWKTAYIFNLHKK
ncbi:hypothetical protein ILUMI_04254, partial [Ignelater luminosus]